MSASMAHRLPGQKCSGCRWWSEMIAKSDSETMGEVHAMCINHLSPRWSRYQAPHQVCEAWASGHAGAVDEPGQITPYPEE